FMYFIVLIRKVGGAEERNLIYTYNNASILRWDANADPWLGWVNMRDIAEEYAGVTIPEDTHEYYEHRIYNSWIRITRNLADDLRNEYPGITPSEWEIIGFSLSKTADGWSDGEVGLQLKNLHWFYGACPYVFTKDSVGYACNNNLLPQSEFPWGYEETQYDIVHLSISPENDSGYYKCRVQELGGTYDFFDRFELKAIDHAPNMIAVASYDGKYYIINPASAILPTTAIEIDSDEPGSADISFDISTIPPDARAVVAAHSPEKASNPEVKVEIWNGRDWERVGYLPARAFPIDEYVSFSVPDMDTLLVRISWDVHYRTDYVRLYANPAPIEPTNFPFVSASHSAHGDVTAQLLKQDAKYIGLLPDEYIDLRFTADSGPDSGLVRDYFFVTNGYFLEAWFQCVSDSAGLRIPGAYGWRGAVWYDYNNDGYQDAGLSTPGRLYLFRNNQDETFTAVDGELGIHREYYFNGAGFGDYDNDGDDDLYLAGQFMTTHKGHLYRNDGDTFVDVTDEAGVPATADNITLSWVDYNRDGWLDLYVLAPPYNVLYRNNGDGTFTEVPSSASGINVYNNRHSGIWGDYD
ncbi:MAG: FG-GAP repeat domain-containing protein, partial [bacterium]